MIEHIGVYVEDLEAAKEFFVHYFDADVGKYYHNPATDFCSYFLTFAGGARLELMHRPALIPGVGEGQAGYAHMAFSLGSKEAVDELTQRLQSDGYLVVSGPRVTGDGYYESLVLGPEGNRIELTI